MEAAECLTIRRRTLKGYLVLKHSGWYRGLEWKEMEYRNHKGKQGKAD